MGQEQADAAAYVPGKRGVTYLEAAESQNG